MLVIFVGIPFALFLGFTFYVGTHRLPPDPHEHCRAIGMLIRCYHD